VSRVKSTTVPEKTTEAFHVASHGGLPDEHEHAHVATGIAKPSEKRIIAIETPTRLPKFRIREPSVYGIWTTIMIDKVAFQR
jgi:hypothetical protein